MQRLRVDGWNQVGSGGRERLGEVVINRAHGSIANI